MSTFEVCRFEKQLIAACSEMMNEALRLVGCELSPKVFLVGYSPLTGFVTVIPDEHEIDTTVVEDYLRSSLGEMAPFPDDPSLTDTDWKTAFQQHDRSLWQCWQCFRDAIDSELSGRFWMVSMSPCCEVYGHVVALVATYNKVDYEKYPRLDMSILRDHGRWPSLHFGVVEAVLNKFAEELRMKDAGRRHGFETDSAREVIRVAGAFFMRTHAWFGKSFSWLDIQVRGTLDFYQACNSIAAMRYENREGFGTIIVAKRDHVAIETVIELDKPFLVTEFRRARKLLETCRGELSVLTDSRYMWGLGRIISDLHLTRNADILTVHILGQSHWRLAYRKDDLMDVLYGEPRLPQPPADLNEVKAKITNKFPSLRPGAADTLVKLVSFAVKSEHGTMVVISERAAEQAARLTKPNRGIKPFDPDEATITAASAIDGAILVDLVGKCYGIGVILDGLAGDGENSARGARYNSAVRYLQGNPDSLIVVVSEDRTVDTIN